MEGEPEEGEDAYLDDVQLFWQLGPKGKSPAFEACTAEAA